MSWEEDFATQWQTFMKVVQTRVRRECVARGHGEATAINTVLESERSKWDNSNHYRGAWLRKLRREHQGIADAFEIALSEVRAVASLHLSVSKSRVWIPLLVVVILSPLTFFILRLLDYAWWQQWTSAVVVAMLVFPFLYRKVVEKGQKHIDASLSALLAKLDSEGHRLRSIVAQADKGEQSMGSPHTSL